VKPRTALLGAIAAAVLMFAGDAAFGQAPNEQPGGLWMPPSASSFGPDVDFMYTVIVWLTGVTFFLVEGLLLLFCVMYRRRPGHRPQYTHGSTTAELIWTIAPGVIFLGLAIWQIPAWNLAKKNMPKPGDAGVTHIQIIGRQFKFNYRYPMNEKEREKYGCEYPFMVIGENPLYVPFGNKVVADLRSSDVIHSFFIPHMRVKQDAVPGMRGRIWFEPSRMMLIKLKDANGAPDEKQTIEWIKDPKVFEPGGTHFSKKIAVRRYQNFINQDTHATRYLPLLTDPWGTKPEQIAATPVKALSDGAVKSAKWGECDYAVGIYDIACAELCGLGHYTMNSYLYVVPKAAYEAWLVEMGPESDDPADKGTKNIWRLWKD